MSWGEIKYAINSGLGTSYFTPLNELIQNRRVLHASRDVTYLQFYPSLINYTVNTELESYKIKMLSSGTLLFRGFSSKPGILFGPRVNIYKNDVQITHILIDRDTSDVTVEGDLYYTDTNSITFNPGDVFYVKFSTWRAAGGNPTGELKVNVSIMGELIESVHTVI